MANKRNLIKIVLTILLFMAAMVCPAAAAKIIYVDANGGNNSSRANFQPDIQYPSIQAAIDAAIDGDTIILASGTFRGDGNRDIDFKGKAITLRSTDPNDPNIVAATIIDCQGDNDEPHRGFYFHSGEDANSILAGITITNGYAAGSYRVESSGGGIYCEDSSPRVSNCTFTGNSAEDGGGGMYNYRGNPALANCSFIGNSAGSGGGMYNADSEPTLTKCTFSGNFAVENGGGMNNRLSFPRLTSCVFLNNSAGIKGGGMQSYSSHIMLLVNCKFTGNWTEGDGGAIYIEGGSAPLDNCTLAGNRAGNEGGGILLGGASVGVENCILWGNSDSGGVDASAQIHLLPDILGAWAVVFYFSCIQGWTGDLGGTGIISDDPCFVSPGYWDPNGTPVDVNDDFWVAGDYHLLDDSPCIDAGDNSVVPSSVSTDLDGWPRIINGTVDMGAYEYQGPRTIYVDAEANGANDGSSWTNAYNYLQDAVAHADLSPKPVEIRVARGVYTPDRTSREPNGTGNREATFRLLDGVTLKGGYAGLSGDYPEERGIEKYKTILSGDLEGDNASGADACDLLYEPTRSENSYHVVSAIGTDTTAILDGFIITAGNADYPISWPKDHRSYGGGLYIEKWKHATVVNCTFTNNSGQMGGGIFYDHSKPSLRNCIFIANATHAFGGGAYDGWSSRAEVTECKFNKNWAPSGGGIYTSGSETCFTRCSFSANRAVHGGGMYNDTSDPTLKNCIFTGNWARYGGAIHNEEESETILLNCTFSGNSAPYDPYEEIGGAGGAIYNWGGSRPTITNCILWANTPDQISGERCSINYCCIEGWTVDLDGAGNIGDAPCFADANNGDYHLKSQAGRWDANDGRWTKDEVTSPCIDAGDPGSPIGYEPFPNGGRVNMGAYGGTAEASKSYFGEPVCETIVAGDINGDCRVNFEDFALMALHWLQDENRE